MLKRLKIPHNVLNAKQHGREAEVVARAGQVHAVTIATNMAGRGTDIKLGPEVKELGGLKILGTERHESRRIDLQLRGRSGRQGDPGASRFYLSLEDDLMRLFSSDRVASVMDRLGLQEGEVIEAGMVTKAVERAQKKVEARNYSIRKHLLEYDNVMNQQREVIYDRRQAALDGLDLKEEYNEVIENYVDTVVEKYSGLESDIELWDWSGLQADLGSTAMVQIPDTPSTDLDSDKLRDMVSQLLRDSYETKAEITGSPENFKRLQQFVYLRVVDEKWREHLYEMDQMKEGINLRAVGQKDPLIEYKKEGYQLFVKMLDLIDREVLKLFFHARIVDERENRMRKARNLSSNHAESSNMGFLNALPQTGEPGNPNPSQPGPPQKQKPISVDEKVGRNDPCPCGSGLKYKKCHGK
jgi:preprotein translocase subunit SecA